MRDKKARDFEVQEKLLFGDIQPKNVKRGKKDRKEARGPKEYDRVLDPKKEK